VCGDPRPCPTSRLAVITRVAPSDPCDDGCLWFDQLRRRLPRGLVLVGTSPGRVWEYGWVNRIVGAVVNGFRSLLLIILLVAVIPLTRVIVGNSIGTATAIVPLSISGIPYFGRVSEVALHEVDRGFIGYGYQRFETPVMIAVIVVLVAMLAHIQAAVDWLARSVDHR
jgi:ABC-type methionine transport system permease subunit